jgi:predicted AAA+ superfamily ATPase
MIELRRRLDAAGAVVIEGPKACGKTETAKRQAGSEVLLDVDAQALAAARVDPSLVLNGPIPRLLDEWQVEPAIWNHVRRAVDERQAAGQFILTGSSVPPDDVDRHTGAGRFSFLRMRPMSLAESGHTSGQVRFSEMFAGVPVRAADSGMTVPRLAELITIGGWPAQQGASVGAAAQAAIDYLHQVCTVDIGRVGGARRDPVKVEALVRSLARNVATEVTITTLAADAGGADGELSRVTVSEYLTALDRLMVIEDQAAWAPHLRSTRQLRSSAKRHFADPSLAVAALRAGPERLLQDLNFFGLLFESLVVRDLRVLSQPLGGSVLHYRDNKGLEVDAVVELADGRWAAFEIKLGQAAIDQAATSLSKFRDIVDIERRGEPAVLGVITATGYGYVRADGIAVIPIGTLRA